MNQNMKELKLRISHIKNSQRSQHREIKMTMEEIYKILELLINNHNSTDIVLNQLLETQEMPIDNQIKNLLSETTESK